MTLARDRFVRGLPPLDYNGVERPAAHAGQQLQHRQRAIMTDSAHILVVDNYDSFVYTIVGYLKTL
ncbi:MAG: hypothetical protein LKG01_08585, partial [Bifidobacterium subtile]|nr:hypothetical protein [Bifidobacterium subtile]